MIDGLTGDQRFFLAFAQAWRGNQRDDAIKTQVASDPHSPRRFRVIGPLRNLDAWYEAFNIGPDSKYYIPPEEARPDLVVSGRSGRAEIPPPPHNAGRGAKGGFRRG